MSAVSQIASIQRDIAEATGRIADLGHDREALHAYLALAGCRWISPGEVVSACGGGIPPRALWPNIVPTMIVADAARERLGRAILVTSAWRSKLYNGSIRNAASLSQHLAFLALDLHVVEVGRWIEKRQHELQELLIRWRSDGKFFEVPAGLGWNGTVNADPLLGRAIPWKQIEVWERDGGSRVFRMAGGIGRYASFTHLDLRGFGSTWGAAS